MDSDNHFCHSLPSLVRPWPFPSFCSSTEQQGTHGEVDEETELVPKRPSKPALQPGLPCGRAHCWASTVYLAALGHENKSTTATTEQTIVTQCPSVALTLSVGQCRVRSVT